MHTPSDKTPIDRLRKSKISAALLALRRVRRLLDSDSTSAGDVIKAAAMLMDHVPDDEPAETGDFTVCLGK